MASVCVLSVCLFVCLLVSPYIEVLINPRPSCLSAGCIASLVLGKGAGVLARDCMHSASAATPIIISKLALVHLKYLCTLLIVLSDINVPDSLPISMGSEKPWGGGSGV